MDYVLSVLMDFFGDVVTSVQYQKSEKSVVRHDILFHNRVNFYVEFGLCSNCNY